jgi:hypothetical protein
MFFSSVFREHFFQKKSQFSIQKSRNFVFFLRGEFKGKMWKDCVVKWGKSGRNVEREWVDKISDCVGGISSGISDCVVLISDCVGMELDGFQIVWC